MSSRSTLSSSRSHLRNSTSSSSNSSGHRPRSINKALDSITPGVKDSSGSQHRSGSISRIMTQTQSKRTIPLVAQNDTGTDIVNTAADTNIEEQNVENLNTSTGSVATEEMETSPREKKTFNDSTPVIKNARQTKGTINKDQLVDQFFVRSNTGGYYCKLCQGTKNEHKVSKSYLAQSCVVRMINLTFWIDCRFTCTFTWFLSILFCTDEANKRKYFETTAFQINEQSVNVGLMVKKMLMINFELISTSSNLDQLLKTMILRRKANEERKWIKTNYRRILHLISDRF